MIDWLSSMRTSATSASFSRNAGRFSLSSTVTDTETSDVVIRSTEISSSSKMAKSRARKPCAPSILFEVMCTTAMLRFTATARGPALRSSPSRVITVPGLATLCVFSTRTGMLRPTAGAMVFGCSTFAPNHASSAASS